MTDQIRYCRYLWTREKFVFLVSWCENFADHMVNTVLRWLTLCEAVYDMSRINYQHRADCSI